jgi:sporadic carbohydrate cluster protein (TIGR04323 family)
MKSLILNNKKFRGYISSRKINGNFIPQKLQNLALRDFANSNNIDFQLSATEWIIKKSYLMIRSIVSNSSKIDGLLFFSVMQISENIKFFEKIMIDLIMKKKIIIFVLENEIIFTKKQMKELISNLKIKKGIDKIEF